MAYQVALNYNNADGVHSEEEIIATLFACLVPALKEAQKRLGKDRVFASSNRGDWIWTPWGEKFEPDQTWNTPNVEKED